MVLSSLLLDLGALPKVRWTNITGVIYTFVEELTASQSPALRSRAAEVVLVRLPPASSLSGVIRGNLSRLIRSPLYVVLGLLDVKQV